MNLPIKLLSTDFDGTLFAEFENPPIPKHLIQMIANLQAQGAKWVINTGRDMSSLMEALARSHVEIKPDYLILVEREIHSHKDMQYVGLDDWNSACHHDHKELFVRVRQDLPRLISWVESQYKATIYEDPYSPFCLIAQNNGDADAIHAYMEDYCKEVPNLQVVRNDVYARFAHISYNKGTALAELGRRLGITSDHIFAAGDHLNDIPMLHQRYARYLATPANAIPEVKELVLSQKGFVSKLFQGHGIAEGLKFHLEKTA